MQRAILRAHDNHLQIQNLRALSLSSTSTLGISGNSVRRNHASNEIAFLGVSETTKPDGHALVQMIRNCMTQAHTSYGEQLHCYVLQSGFSSNVFVSTALVSFYAKMVSLEDARKVFEEMPQRNVVSWNTMISGYAHSGKLQKALSFFLELNKSEILADAYSCTPALAACGQLRLLRLGMSIHSRIVMYGLESSVVVGNCLIDMYGKCCSVEDAIRVFHGLVEKDVISWNSVIAASARNQRLEQAFAYIYQMPCPDTISYNELINGVAQFGNIDEAIDILRSIPNPDSSSWNSIISGYMVRNRTWEALGFFTQMHAKGVIMDVFTFSSILSGIARVSSITWGTSIHCCTVKHGLVASTIIGSALISMYSKCGQVRDAEILFRSLPSKNIVTWSTIISGFAHNGESDKVIQYFEGLQGEKELRPDDITFVNLLAACSHNKMPLEQAYKYFSRMINEYGIEPTPEHLASMIRLMGHDGEVARAKKMIYELGFGSCKSVWKALLGACDECGNLEVAKVAAAKMVELGGDDDFGTANISYSPVSVSDKVAAEDDINFVENNFHDDSKEEEAEKSYQNDALVVKDGGNLKHSSSSRTRSSILIGELKTSGVVEHLSNLPLMKGKDDEKKYCGLRCVCWWSCFMFALSTGRRPS
ncbi:hypothetical protein Cgig2_005257 [Carnegiea gigantea]|uniref:Pentatricopeptide repeat-containing protein n=1 Tax=Carnegiea gigantea TaxID=171969 RepID=A0A9Q1QBP5_9CARY|nr:hypothetical protein Cgig2_005257 [Carnegiea gigantea]